MDDFLLNSDLSKELYETYAKDLPIIDYHNHINISDVVSDRTFENLTQLWITSDPYKHRAMRILGIQEHYITGNATDYEKFEKWYGCLPMLIGNALYDWSLLELKTIFGIETDHFQMPAQDVWNQANQVLKNLSAQKILSHFPIAYSAPCASIVDDLSHFEALDSWAPSLRGDDMLSLEPAFIDRLSIVTSKSISDLQSYLEAISSRLDRFLSCGCRFADHALDAGFRFIPDDGNNEDRFSQLLQGNPLSEYDHRALFSRVLTELGAMYASRRLTLQLHIGALRHTSTRLRAVAGPAGGYAGIGSPLDASSLTQLFDAIEQKGSLPKTILFTLNPADNAVLAILSGSYSADGKPAIVTQGPAWWWCDHYQGMNEMLEHFSAYSVLSTFVGMTTDSRSLLSFVRHDYFRRVLCRWLAKQAQHGIYPNDKKVLGSIIQKTCYNNAKELI